MGEEDPVRWGEPILHPTESLEQRLTSWRTHVAPKPDPATTVSVHVAQARPVSFSTLTEMLASQSLR